MDLFSKTLPIAQLADSWRAEDAESRRQTEELNARLKKGETVTTTAWTGNYPINPDRRADELTMEIVKLQQTLGFVERVIEAAYAVADKPKTEHLQQLHIALLEMRIHELKEMPNPKSP